MWRNKAQQRANIAHSSLIFFVPILLFLFQFIYGIKQCLPFFVGQLVALIFISGVNQPQYGKGRGAGTKPAEESLYDVRPVEIPAIEKNQRTSGLLKRKILRWNDCLRWNRKRTSWASAGGAIHDDRLQARHGY